MNRWSAKRPLAKGLLILSLGIGGFVAWSTIAEIDGAVVATGQVAVEARAQAIQHPDGGLVVALHVRDGSRVAEGDPVLTLDGSELLAQQVVSQRSLIELLARMDRLRAEIRSAEAIAFGEELRGYAREAANVDGILVDETALFEARRATLDQTEAQLRERQIQTESIVAGRERQLDASRRQLALIEEDLATQESLFERGLTDSARLSGLRREAARLDGEIGELEAGIAEARSAIAGFEVERLRQEAAFREAAQAELRELQPREAEIRERLRLIATQTNRLVLRAPMAGTVLGLQVHTVGGVVPAGAEVASIIPADVPLILSIEIDPGQIDRVHAGQDAMIRFPNFNARTTPEVEGLVRTVSADAVTDPATGRRFFIGEVEFAPGAQDALGEVALQPGMPVEVFIRTDARTPASFLLKPMADYWAYAMREE